MTPVGSPQTRHLQNNGESRETEPLLSPNKSRTFQNEDAQAPIPTTHDKSKKSHTPEKVVSTIECAAGVGIGVYSGVKIYSEGESDALWLALSAGIGLVAAGVFGLVRAFSRSNVDKKEQFTEVRVDQGDNDNFTEVSHEVNRLYHRFALQNGSTDDLSTERHEKPYEELNRQIKAVVESLLDKIEKLETARPTQFIEMTKVISGREDLESELADTKRRLQSALLDIEQFETDLTDAKESIAFYEVQLSDLRSTINDLARAHEENDMSAAKSILSQADSTLSQTRSNASRANQTSSRLSRTSLDNKIGLSPVHESKGEKSSERFLDDDSE